MFYIGLVVEGFRLSAGIAMETMKCEVTIALVNDIIETVNIPSKKKLKRTKKPKENTVNPAGIRDVIIFFFSTGLTSKLQSLPHTQQILVP